MMFSSQPVATATGLQPLTTLGYTKQLGRTEYVQPLTTAAYTRQVSVPASVTQVGYSMPVVGGSMAAPTTYTMPSVGVSETNKLTVDHASNDKELFVKFLKRATADKNSHEFSELYHFLLQVFIESDTDFDGMIHQQDFDIMVERAGALPRKWGFAPTSAEAFPTKAARDSFRKAEFAKINTSGTGKISFDEWLAWSYTHICEKATLLDESRAATPLVTKSTDRNAFAQFVIAAAKSRHCHEYKELYHFLQDCFTTADHQKIGKIGPNDFDEMIEIAAEAPRHLGFAPPASQTYRSIGERKAARAKMFTEMDPRRTGFISFSAWLEFAYKHICGKAKLLDATLTGLPPPMAGQEPSQYTVVPAPMAAGYPMGFGAPLGTVIRPMCPTTGAVGTCPVSPRVIGR